MYDFIYWLLSLAALMAPAQSASATSPAAAYIGEARCIQCHGQENQHFGETLHAKVFRLNPKNEVQAKSCEACHGPGSNHARNVTDKTALIGFTKQWGTPIAAQNAQNSAWTVLRDSRLMPKLITSTKASGAKIAA